MLHQLYNIDDKKSAPKIPFVRKVLPKSYTDCQLCGSKIQYLAGQAHCLVKHASFHTDIFPHQCSGCSKTFPNIQQCMSHISRLHRKASVVDNLKREDVDEYVRVTNKCFPVFSPLIAKWAEIMMAKIAIREMNNDRNVVGRGMKKSMKGTVFFQSCLKVANDGERFLNMINEMRDIEDEDLTRATINENILLQKVLDEPAIKELLDFQQYRLDILEKYFKTDLQLSTRYFNLRNEFLQKETIMLNSQEKLERLVDESLNHLLSIKDEQQRVQATADYRDQLSTANAQVEKAVQAYEVLKREVHEIEEEKAALKSQLTVLLNAHQWSFS